MSADPQATPLVLRGRSWRWARGLAALVLIVSAVWLAYWPSLGQVTGADQLDYLINLFGHDTTWDIFAHTYSYNRTRVVGVGDTMCFRPLFFAWLAWQQAWYGADLTAWQATGVVLHCVVCLLFFRLLRLAAQAGGSDTSGKYVTALVLTLFVAMNPYMTVMVVWTHINGYLVFLICTLLALELLLREAIDNEPTARRSWFRLSSAWLLLGAAAFTYELGQATAIAAGIFLLVMNRDRRRRGLALLLVFGGIALGYQVANWVDLRIHAGQYVPDLNLSSIARLAWSWDTLDHLRRLFHYSLIQPWFLGTLTAQGGGRLEIRELSWSQFKLGFWTFVGVVALVAWGTLVVRSLVHILRNRSLDAATVLSGDSPQSDDAISSTGSHPGSRPVMGVAALVALLLAVYMAMIVCGRMNIRPSSDILARNSYYSYIPLLLLLLWGGLVWMGTTRSPRRVVWSTLWAVEIVALVLLGFYGGFWTHLLNRLHTGKSADGVAIRAIDSFIRQHGDEPGFGLAFDMDQARLKGVALMSVFFHRYEDNYHPTHVVWWRNNMFGILAVKEYFNKFPRAERPLFPDLVKVGTRFHVYYFGGKYQAMSYDDTEWHLICSADSLEEAERLATARLNEMKPTTTDGTPRR